MALLRRRHGRGAVLRRRSGRGTAVTVIRVVGAVFAGILVLHILFGLLGANPNNSLVATVGDVANALALWFVNLFTMNDANLQLLLNYGLAAIFWLVVAGLLARVVGRAG